MSKGQQDRLAALWARYLRLVEELEGPGGPDGLDRLEALLTSPDMQALWEEALAAEAKAGGLVQYKTTLPVSQVKAVNFESHLIRGYASTFGNVDLQGDEVQPGAFLETIQAAREYAQRWHRGQALWTVLFQHDANRPVGAWTSAREDGTGLLVEGKIDVDFEDGRQAWSCVRNGTAGLSIGYAPRRIGWRGKTRLLRTVDLREISIVTRPANPAARITSVD